MPSRGMYCSETRQTRRGELEGERDRIRSANEWPPGQSSNGGQGNERQEQIAVRANSRATVHVEFV